MNEYATNVNFIDLVKQQERIREPIEKAIQRVLQHGQYIMGPEVAQLETELSSFTKAKHSITCANGTDALSLALMSLELNQGDVVFVPSFTYVASAEAPAQLGLIPFLVDVCEDTFNISPQSLKDSIFDAKKQGFNCKAIIIVDLFGQPSNFFKINELASEEGLKVIIDGAQSFGATINGKRVGSMGDITTTSFFLSKPLGCYGDGGALFTNDDELSEIIKSLRLHGKGSEKYDNVRVGMNSRLDTIQAAILLEKLKIFPDELNKRQTAADTYLQVLKESKLKLPEVDPSMTSAWAQYTVKSDSREDLINKLSGFDIPTGIYYPKALHQQRGYSQFPKAINLSASEKLTKISLSLPMHPYLDNNYFHKISEILN